jgi:hypothetical protein
MDIVLYYATWGGVIARKAVSACWAATFQFRESPACFSLLDPRATMSSEPIDVQILRLTGEPYPEYGGKTSKLTNDWSCYICTKAGEVGIIGFLLCSDAYGFLPSNLQFSARIRRGNPLRFGSLLTNVISNNTYSVRRVNRETQ